MIQNEVIVSTPQVETEIKERNFNSLAWPDENNIIFQPLTNTVMQELGNLSSRFEDWYTHGHEKNKTWADPELIAFAKTNDLVLVTMEKWNYNSKLKNHKIPTICGKLGAYIHIRDEQTNNINKNTPFQCIDLVEFFKREKMYARLNR